MSVRTKRLVLRSVTALDPVPLSLYTCPAGFTALVKQVSWTNLAGAPQNLQLYINAVTGPATNVAHDNTLTGAGESRTFGQLFFVLEPGDQLMLYTTGAFVAPLLIGVFGSELAGTAP